MYSLLVSSGLLSRVIADFSQNELMLNICRALQGLGHATFFPSSIMILAATVPAQESNLYVASAPGYGVLFRYNRWSQRRIHQL
jgi:predicted MFS family arabinose efflux permease